MEQEEQEPKPKLNKTPGRGRSLLTSAILLGASMFSRGNTNADNPQNPEGAPDSTYSQVDNNLNLKNQVFVPELARDAEKREVEQVQFANLRQGIDSTFESQKNSVIKDRQTWEEYWQKMNPNSNVPIPEIDFDKEVIIFTAQGPTYDNRHAIEISGIETDGSDVDILITSTTPAENCPITQRLTSAYQAVKTERLKQPDGSDRPVNFEFREDKGCYDIGVASSVRTDGQEHNFYGAQTVNKTLFVP